tara:strand:- start:137 stop:877 length:741 start_codon:yes stop_codon:yes gene_type:complete
MLKKKIVWEKWIDPLNSNVDEVEFPGYNSPSIDQERPIEFLSSDQNFEESIEEHLEHSDGIEERRHITYNPIRIASTQHGFISLTEHSFASKHFDFWTLHYTQDITEEILSTIESCKGVETLNALTRYRVRIGFNRPLIQAGAFDLNELRKNIENKILGLSETNSYLYDASELLFFTRDVKERVKNIKSNMSKGGLWAIYVLPNGKIETITESPENKGEVFNQKLDLFLETKALVGGEIIASGTEE